MNQGNLLDEKNRLWLIDALRGFALFGILWVNIFMRSDPIQLISIPQPLEDLRWFVIVSGEWKFRSMFSFLFGFGLAMQLSRTYDGNRFETMYLRRLFILLLLGLMHIAFWWPGDILVLYAVCGVFLLLFRNASSRLLLTLACLLPLAPLTVDLAGIKLFNLATLKADVISGYQVYGHGSFWEITARRIYDYSSFYIKTLYLSFPRVMGMMLLGIWFERQGLFQRIASHKATWQKIALWGYLTGIPANMVYAEWKMTNGPTLGFTLLAKLCHDYGAAALCLAYMATFVLLCQLPVMARLLKHLAPMGRMSMTAYLSHSVIGAFIFYSYGLGLFGQLNSWQCIGLVFVICLAQMLVSTLWFRYCRIGPVEWLWRWGSYGSRPALRRAGTEALTPA